MQDERLAPFGGMPSPETFSSGRGMVAPAARPTEAELPMGYTNPQIDRNVSDVQRFMGDIAQAAQSQREMRADMARLYDQGAVTRQALEAEYRTPTMGAAIPGFMRRQVAQANPADVATRAAAAQNMTYMMPSAAQQAILAGLNVRDPQRSTQYAENAAQRAAGLLGPLLRDELAAWGQRRFGR